MWQCLVSVRSQARPSRLGPPGRVDGEVPAAWPRYPLRFPAAWLSVPQLIRLLDVPTTDAGEMMSSQLEGDLRASGVVTGGIVTPASLTVLATVTHDHARNTPVPV